MEENKTNLRQSEAKVEVVGILSEKDLKLETEDGKTSIKGSLTLKTSDVNFIKFNVNVGEMTKQGKPNSLFAGIKTVMDEYKAISDGYSEEDADKVSVSNGDLNLYRNKNTGAEVVGYKSNFFNRVTRIDEEHPWEPKAEFSVEVFITSIVPETNTDAEETGRVVVNGWVPTYNGIEPIKLVAPEGEVASAIDSTFEPGETVEFFGEIVNNRIETIQEIPVAIGKPRKKVKTTWVNDLVITAASEAYEEGISANAPYDANVIKAAIQERENRIAEEKAKATTSNAGTAKPSAAAKGRTLGF
jgi:hypothetical protein